MNYYDKNIIEIHNDLINKKVTSKELIDFSKNKILETNEKFNAYNLVLDSKENNEINTLLSGIPYAMKDNISTKGIRTTACSNTLKDYVPIYNATVYEKLCKNGAVMIGKTNMDELAMGGTGLTGNAGIVKNPYDEERISAGSSAGSAVAVATKTVPFAIGTDTGDSIRKPAAYTGVVGYKPSYGLISRYGLFAFASSLDTIGVITNSVIDAATVVNTVKGSDDKDMTTIKDMDEIDLTKDDEYSVTGYNGDVLIEVKNGMIRVKKENSPLNICSKQGFVKDMPIICLPNKIVIKLGNNELDSVTS